MMEERYGIFKKELINFIHIRVDNMEASKAIFENIFAKIGYRVHYVEKNCNIVSWIYQIVQNEIIDHYGKKRGSDGTDLANFYPGPTENEKSDFLACMSPFLTLLSEDEKSIIDDIDFKNLSQKQYAEKHNLKYSTVKYRIQTARKRLKGCFTLIYFLQ